MKMLLLQDEILDYLQNVLLRRELASGMITAEELPLATALWEHLTKAQTVDFSKLGSASLEAKENGVALNFEVEAGSPETTDPL